MVKSLAQAPLQISLLRDISKKKFNFVINLKPYTVLMKPTE